MHSNFLGSTVWQTHSYFAEFEFRCYRDLGKPGSMGLSDLLRSQTVALSLTTQFLSQLQPLVLLNMKIYFSLFLIGFLLLDLWKTINWKNTDVQESLKSVFSEKSRFVENIIIASFNVNDSTRLLKIEEILENVATKSSVEEGLVTVELQIILHE